MAKNIRLNETDYKNVSKVKLPTTDGGTAEFLDVDEAPETGDTVYESKYGVLYKKNMVLESTNIPTGASMMFAGMTYMESFEAPNFCGSAPSDTNGTFGSFYIFSGNPALKRVILPTVKKFNAYMPFMSNQDGIRPPLEEFQLGSVGHPFESFQYDFGINHADFAPTVTIYVADETELPLSGHPWDAPYANIVYRSSTTGEIREYTTGE